MNTANFTIVKPSLDSEAGALSYYTQSAVTYDWRTGYETVHHREAVRLAGIGAGDRALEVACGTGRATVELAQAVGPSGRLDAIDLTNAMLQKARRKVQAHGLQQRVEFRLGNAKRLPYEDGTFDVLYNAYMFDLIPVEQFVPILCEFRRVLKPGGRLVLVNMSKGRPGRTFFESLYERGWGGACRPVYLSPALQAAGFENVMREYRKNSILFLTLPFGTEIVTARKSRF